MPFEIKRREVIKDTITLKNADGTTADTIDFAIDPHVAVHEYQIAQETLKQAQAENSIDKVGLAIVAIFNVLFGKPATERLIAFYNGRETEMLEDIMPYIQSDIVPKMRAASAALRDKFKAMKGNV